MELKPQVQRFLARCRPDALLCLVLAALPLLLFWRMLLASPDQRLTIREGDFTQEYFPLALVASSAVRAGELPFWNPLTGGGQPLLGDPQTALLYPPTWLVLPRLRGPDSRSLQVFQQLIPLHFSLAGLGGYALGRYAFRSRFGAIMLALTFAYSGYLLSYPTQQLPILRTAAWLPWQVLALLVALDRRTLAWTALAGVATALSVLAGHPQTSLFHLYALAILTVAWWLARLDRSRGGARDALTGLGHLSLAVAIGFALAAPQVLSSLELTRLSTRTEVSFSFLANGFSPREVVLGLVAPRILGGAPPYVGGLPIYVGVVPLLFAATGLLVSRGRMVLVGGLLASFGLFLSLGGHSVLFSLLFLVAPGFSLFRGQERGIELFAFGMAVLAGAGADALSRPLGPLARRRLRWLLRVSPPGVLLSFTALAIVSRSATIPVDSAASDGLKNWMDSVGWLTLMLALGLALLTLGLVKAGVRRLLPVAAAALVVLDLLSIAPDANLQDVRPDDVYRASGIVNALRDAPAPFRIVNHDVLNGHHGLAYGLSAIEPGFILKVRRYERVREAAPPQLLFDLFDGRYLVTRERHDELPLLLEEAFGDATNRLYQLPAGPGRAWFAEEAVAVSSPDESLRATLSEGFQPARTVVLETESISTPFGSGSVRDVQVGWSRTNLVAQSDQGGYVLISQTSFPGWTGYVDGSPTPVLAANHALTALWVPAGQHQVALRYEPTYLRAGVAASAASGVLCVALFLLPFVSRKRSSTAA